MCFRGVRVLLSLAKLVLVEFTMGKTMYGPIWVEFTMIIQPIFPEGPTESRLHRKQM